METGCDIPINITHVITKLIFAHFAEGHTPAFESRMVLACKDIGTQTTGLYFNLTDFLDNLTGFHQGTSTLLIIFETISSLVILLASAS